MSFSCNPGGASWACSLGAKERQRVATSSRVQLGQAVYDRAGAGEARVRLDRVVSCAPHRFLSQETCGWALGVCRVPLNGSSERVKSTGSLFKLTRLEVTCRDVQICSMPSGFL
jgi:hypothetical protein